MKKLAILFGFLLSTISFAHMDGESVVALGDDATEAQKTLVRDGAQDFCDGKGDGKEECVMDFFANHNLEEEPSCD